MYIILIVVLLAVGAVLVMKGISVGRRAWIAGGQQVESPQSCPSPAAALKGTKSGDSNRAEGVRR